MNCPVCKIHPAIKHPVYGFIPCPACQDRQGRLTRPGSFTEFTTEDIKGQRKEFMDDIEQPHYKGALNKKWVDLWGKEAAIEHGFNKEEIENARYVYDQTGIRYYNDGG